MAAVQQIAARRSNARAELGAEATALACVSYFGFEDDATLHVASALALLIVLALKICVVRWWHRLGHLLPVLAISVWVLLAMTWLSSAGGFLADS